MCAAAVLVSVAGLTVAGTPLGTLDVATAQTVGSPDTVAALRAEADRAAVTYFATLARVRELDAEITQIETQVADLETRAARARDSARARALAAYQDAGSHLEALVNAGSVLATSRRVLLIDRVNHVDQRAYRRLRRASAELDEQRRALASMRDTQDAELSTLRQEAAEIDTKLAEAARQESAQLAATTPTTTPSTTSPTPTAAAPSAAPTTTTAPPTTVPPPPGYVGTPGVHPRHDDPFLTCVRQRESGGNYSAVNRSGPYLGAYQFAQSTWNAVANHTHRLELVGLPANLATPYDQDDMAWALYQWQGEGPWGGCP